MSSLSNYVPAILAIVAVSVAVPISAHAQPPTYDVTPIATVPSALLTSASGVNDHGDVVGSALIGASGFNPWVALAGQPATLLPLLPGHVGGAALAINNAGVIAGSSGTFMLSDVAVIWTPGPSGYTVTPLPLTPGGKQPRRARALNELGDVVGEMEPNEGFWWTASGGTVDVATLGLSHAADINEARQLIGGTKRIDLDTLVVDTAPIGSGTLMKLNDAGVATWNRIAGNQECGIWDASSGATTLHSAPGFYQTGGIDYASTVAISAAPGWLAIDGVGKVVLQSCIDPTSGWTAQVVAATSATGLMVAEGANASLGSAGPILLTPRRFRAILEGAPGIEGLPVLAGEGSLEANELVTFRLSHANPSSPVGLIAGLTRADLPFYGGTLVPTPTLVLTGLSTDASGKLTLTTTWPAGVPAATTVYVQEWVADPSAPFGVAGSNALECVVP